MDRSRRSFLAAGLLGSLGLAGCLSDDSGVEYPGDTTTVTTTPTTEQSPETTTQTPQTTETTTTTAPVPNPSLGARTDEILGEAEWFANEYATVTERYLTHCRQAIATIKQIQASTTLTDNQLRKLRNATMAAANFTDEHLAPHFDAYGPVVEPRLETIERFARRGDLDRADAELEELLTHFQAVGNQHFVQTEFSRDPMEDRIYDLLAAPDRWPNAREEAIFGIRLHDDDFTGWAYPDGEAITRYHMLRYASTAPDFGTLFDPVKIPDGRVGLCSLTVNRLTNSVRWDDDSLPTVPLVIQSYDSPAAAAAARDTAVNTAVTTEGTETFGNTEWDQMYFYHDGDIQYAYLVQAGRHMLTMTANQTPWDERTDADRDTIRRSWLWVA